MRGVEVPGLLCSDVSVLAVLMSSWRATALAFEGGISDSTICIELLQPMVARKAPKKDWFFGDPLQLSRKSHESQQPLPRKVS